MESPGSNDTNAQGRHAAVMRRDTDNVIIKRLPVNRLRDRYRGTDEKKRMTTLSTRGFEAASVAAQLFRHGLPKRIL
jgi:hypothetical protein